MPIKRSPTWLTHELDAFLRSNATTKFAWGVNDCCLFAANAIQAMTGVDIADDFRGKYSDQTSAMALVKSVTIGSSVVDAILHCAAKHGLKEWTDAAGKALPLMAQRGDLVAVTNEGNTIAGVVDLSGRYVAAMGDAGIVWLPISSILRAWRVG